MNGFSLNFTGRLLVYGAAVAVGALVAFGMADQAFAGTGGTEFDSVWTTLTDWMQGALGKVLAGAMILVGIAVGVVRQSLMGFVVGVAGGMGLYNVPSIVDAVMTATLPAAVQAPVIPAAVLTAIGG